MSSKPDYALLWGYLEGGTGEVVSGYQRVLRFVAKAATSPTC